MNKVTLTLLEAVVLCVVGVAVGFAMNAMRGRDSIDLHRDYHPKIKVHAGAEQPAEPSELDAAESPFQLMTLKEVIEVWDDPRFQYEAYVIVDARSDDAYEAGHIPGAVQCDYYRIYDYLEQVVPRVLGAERVVVYCNGVDCDDSLLVCGKLIEVDVPWENIYLFKGGWEKWKQTDYPIETGRKQVQE